MQCFGARGCCIFTWVLRHEDCHHRTLHTSCPRGETAVSTIIICRTSSVHHKYSYSIGAYLQSCILVVYTPSCITASLQHPSKTAYSSNAVPGIRYSLRRVSKQQQSVQQYAYTILRPWYRIPGTWYYIRSYVSYSSHLLQYGKHNISHVACVITSVEGHGSSLRLEQTMSHANLMQLLILLYAVASSHSCTAVAVHRTHAYCLLLDPDVHSIKAFHPPD